MRSDEKPIIYVMLYKKMKEHASFELELNAEQMNTLVSRKLFIFPRFYQKLIIEDMIKFGFLKRKNHMIYVLVGDDCEKILKKYSHPLW